MTFSFNSLPTYTILNWVWTTYGTEIVSAGTKKAWDEIKWRVVAKNYAKKVKILHGTMRILGHSKPVKLEGIYTDVHLLDRPIALNRFGISDLQRHFKGRLFLDPNEKRLSGKEVIQKLDKVYILGKPGAGKTTFLKHLALQAVDGVIEKVPIFISLREFADFAGVIDNYSKILLDFIVEQFDICGFPDAKPYIERLLKSGKALILFDGLDEVNQENEQRVKLTTEMSNFIKKYHNCQFVITCRIAASDYIFLDFT